ESSPRPAGAPAPLPCPRVAPDWPFFLALGLLGGVYILLIVAMLAADAAYTDPDHFWAALSSPQIRYSIKLSLVSCCLTTILSLWVAVPLGYLMSRFEFRGKRLLEAILDIPIVLPPMVIAIRLLILFQTSIGEAIQEIVPVTLHIPAVIIAQFSVACAFAVQAMRATFDQINPRQEQVALTLGCSRAQAFWLVVFPEA